jgi:hypothetical protein
VDNVGESRSANSFPQESVWAEEGAALLTLTHASPAASESAAASASAAAATTTASAAAAVTAEAVVSPDYEPYTFPSVAAK